MVATKFTSDLLYSNARYAMVNEGKGKKKKEGKEPKKKQAVA
jgi:hypothetical protein